MALNNLLMKCQLNNRILIIKCMLPVSTRQGHRMRGKPPGVAKSLEQRLQAENVQDPEITARVNIGFPKLKNARSEELQARLAHLKAIRANKQLEKQARSQNLLVDLKEVEREYRKTAQPFDLRVIADHYGIFKDLFGCAYFVPRVALNIQYALESDTFSPVYNGNVIKPAEAVKEPLVSFDGLADPITGKKCTADTFWTLIATNPDGNLNQNDAELVHWFVGNIPNGDVKKGDVLVDYLPPFPPKGLGYQRFVFVLYKQNAKLDFTNYKIASSDSTKLDKRTFQTLDFYRRFQDDITPAGLAFYQTSWDNTLTDFYHNVLKMKEPIFEYDFPAAYIKDQKHFPIKEPFNLYLDKYRDIKEVNQEYIERKLAKTHPFEGPEAPLRFPNAHPIRNVPSWLRTEIRKQRLKIGRINDY